MEKRTAYQQLLKVLGEKVDGPKRTTSPNNPPSWLKPLVACTPASKKPPCKRQVENAGFEGDWLALFVELAVENIILPFVEVRGTLNLSINATDGISVIRTALEAAESLSNEDEEIDVKCFYDGAPAHRIELRAPDFKIAETLWEQATQAVRNYMAASGGEADAQRE